VVQVVEGEALGSIPNTTKRKKRRKNKKKGKNKE
jgi:hypothetical protein